MGRAVVVVVVEAAAVAVVAVGFKVATELVKIMLSAEAAQVLQKIFIIAVENCHSFLPTTTAQQAV